MKNSKNFKSSGGRVLELRKAARLSQEKLAEMIDCTVQTISNIENDRYKLPFERAYQLAEIFGVTPEYLLCKTDNKHYRGDVELAISKMQQYANMVYHFIDYISMSSGHKKCPLSEEEQKAFFNDVEWYAIARFNRMVTDKKGDKKNAKENK